MGHPTHGERLRAREEKNFKPNGYRAISEAELQAEKRIAAVTHPDPEVAKALSAKLALG